MSNPTTGIKTNEDGSTCCDRCGEDKDFSFVMHTDERRFYTWMFRCNRCDNGMSVRTERSGEMLAYWGDEES